MKIKTIISGSRRLLLPTLLLAIAAGPASAQSCKVVVDARGECVGKLLRTNATTYTITGQDEFDIPKKGHTVVTYSAENGQGVLAMKNPGTVNVRSAPTTDAPVIGRLVCYEGDMPDGYPCLGKQNGWYRVSDGRNIGFVRADLLEWFPIY